MKSVTALFALAALVASVSSHAAPPPGHPTPAAAADMMKLPKGTSDADLPQKGKVLSTIDANEYTYIEVEQGKNVVWVAAPKTAPLKKNSMIRYEDGAVMSNFHSKLLNRTFSQVTFVSRVVVTDK